MSGEVDIRKAGIDDLDSLYKVAELMKASNEKDYFEKCFEEQDQQKRKIIVATKNNDVVGYVQIIWSPIYNLFRRMNIPEIQDLNVIPEMRRCGIGSDLIDYCEKIILDAGYDDAGISFGLHASFGSAQRLYVSKGYVPDGCGICYDSETVVAGSLKPVDDLLTLKLVKSLG